MSLLSVPYRRTCRSRVCTVLAATVLLAASGCDVQSEDEHDTTPDAVVTTHLSADEVQSTFHDATAALGLDAVGPVEQCLAPADLDGDGLEDLLFWRDGAPVVFRRTGDGAFVEVDVTVTGAGDTPPFLRSMTCAVADLDGDGLKDIVVAGLGPNVAILWATGTFEYHQTAVALEGDRLEGDPEIDLDEGVELYTTALVLLDADVDGLLDVHVLRSSVESLSAMLVPDSIPIGMGGVTDCCAQPGIGSWYCCGEWCAGDPASTEPIPGPRHHLFRQLPERAFVDVSLDSGANPNISAWAGALVDADEDSLPDVFLANDFAPNQVLLARGDATFEPAGFARIGDGLFNHAMGLTVADFDADGHLDAAFSEIGFPLFLVGDGTGGFTEVAPAPGYGTLPGAPLSWGIAFTDLDVDGDPDLYLSAQYFGPDLDCWATGASGIRYGIPDRVRDDVLAAQTNLVHLNTGGTFEVVPHAAPVGDYRGTMVVAPVDLDGDFDDDLLTLEFRTGPRDRLHLRAWENAFEGNRRARIRLESAAGDASVLGARIEVRIGDERQVFVAAGPDGYASQRSRQLTIGLGGASSARVRVARPGADFGDEHVLAAGTEVTLDDLD